MVVLAVAWAATAGAIAVTGGNEKIPWNHLVADMARAEPDVRGPVPVYGLEGFVTEPIEFNLGLIGEDAFWVVDVKDLTAPDDQHFWVAFRDTEWKEDRPPQQLMAERGYEVGPACQAGTRDQMIYAFPVWRRPTE